MRSASYWIALTAVALAFVFVLILGVPLLYDPSYGFSGYAHTWATLLEADPRIALSAHAVFLAYHALMASIVTALASLYFGWRRDRRHAAELEYRAKQLEMKLRELEGKLRRRPISN